MKYTLIYKDIIYFTGEPGLEIEKGRQEVWIKGVGPKWNQNKWRHPLINNTRKVLNYIKHNFSRNKFYNQLPEEIKEYWKLENILEGFLTF